jgi:hypothetical protein
MKIVLGDDVYSNSLDVEQLSEVRIKSVSVFQSEQHTERTTIL